MALPEAVGGKFVLLGTKSLLRDVSGILGPVTYLLIDPMFCPVLYVMTNKHRRLWTPGCLWPDLLS